MKILKIVRKIKRNRRYAKYDRFYQTQEPRLKLGSVDKSVDEIAREIVLFYFQSWGQSREERCAAIKMGANYCGIPVFFETEDGKIIPRYNGNDPRSRLWPEFRRELETCFPKGQFEWEMEAVQNVLNEFKKKVARA